MLWPDQYRADQQHQQHTKRQIGIPILKHHRPLVMAANDTLPRMVFQWLVLPFVPAP
jgi:hypothetical protein